MQNRRKIKILGLTGGIAAGKSIAAELLLRKKGFILDADKLAHTVIMKGMPAYEETRRLIEGEYVKDDGEIDRTKLGSVVFNDKKKLALLERIVHKHIGIMITDKINEIRNNPGEYRFIVLDAPLLIESGTDKLCDAVWVIKADYGLRLRRIMERNGLTKEEAAYRISIQTDWDSIQNEGYVYINNDGSFEELSMKVYENLSFFLEN